MSDKNQVKTVRIGNLLWMTKDQAIIFKNIFKKYVFVNSFSKGRIKGR